MTLNPVAEIRETGCSCRQDCRSNGDVDAGLARRQRKSVVRGRLRSTRREDSDG
jgi:hypothetical protein